MTKDTSQVDMFDKVGKMIKAFEGFQKAVNEGQEASILAKYMRKLGSEWMAIVEMGVHIPSECCEEVSAANTNGSSQDSDPDTHSNDDSDASSQSTGFQTITPEMMALGVHVDVLLYAVRSEQRINALFSEAVPKSEYQLWNRRFMSGHCLPIERYLKVIVQKIANEQHDRVKDTLKYAEGVSAQSCMCNGS